MRKFQCRKCGGVVETLTEDYVAPPLLQRERVPTCPDCGLDMFEVID